MKMLVFFLEEPSAEEMLKGILPRLISPDVGLKFIVFQGKSDLEKRVERRMRCWQHPDSSFVILRDQDSGDCRIIKRRLRQKCLQAGKQALIRIACHEIETFYLGDLSAVEKAFGLRGLARKQLASKYRAPDDIASPSSEMTSLTFNRYQKVSGSRAISPFLVLDGSNSSKSFASLITGIKKI